MLNQQGKFKNSIFLEKKKANPTNFGSGNLLQICENKSVYSPERMLYMYTCYNNLFFPRNVLIEF